MFGQFFVRDSGSPFKEDDVIQYGKQILGNVMVFRLLNVLSFEITSITESLDYFI